jgi:DNA-binding response OmpR family regulator
MHLRDFPIARSRFVKEVQVEKYSLALVTIEEELWGVEKVRLALSSAGHRVIAIRSWDTLDVIERIKPDLVLANLAGDRPGDLQLCKWLARPGQAPLVVVGSSVHSDHILAMFEAGITDYLVRPVNPRELVARVNNILHRTQPPFQMDGTAVNSDIQSESHQSFRVPLYKAVRGLVGRLARSMPQRG